MLMPPLMPAADISIRYADTRLRHYAAFDVIDKCTRENNGQHTTIA